MSLVFEFPDIAPAIEARLKASVPSLISVEQVTSLSDVMRRNVMPQRTPAAWVLDLGATGGKHDYTTGNYSQPVTTTIGVVIAARASDRLAMQAGRKLRPISLDVMVALSGWSPDIDQMDRLQFSRDRLVEVNATAIWRQVEFTTEWTLYGSEANRAQPDDFNSAGVKWELAPVDGTTDAEDNLETEQ